MSSDQRMDNATPLPKIRARRFAFPEAQLARLVVDILEEDLPPLNGPAQFLRERFESLVG
ncbi:hypothetical protein D9M72_619450 [compost metagenome]